MMKRCQAVKSVLLLLFLLLLPLLSGCATLPYEYPRTISTALYLPEATILGRDIQPLVAKHLGASGFYLLPSGLDAFLARVLMIDAAEKTIDLQYYIFQADLTGKFMLDRILAAAERGVRVRLLIDDWRETAQKDRWLTLMEIYPNIEVRVFNPFGGLRANSLTRPLQAIFGPQRLKARMHNKAFICDNSVAIIGGRNIGDEYFGASANVYFRDLDVMALGPIARQVSAGFDAYWNSVLSIPIKALVSNRLTPDDLEKARHDLASQRESLKNSSYGIKMRQSDFLKRAVDGRLPVIWAPAEVLSDEPFKVIRPDSGPQSTKMAREVRGFLESARHELLMISPYLVPGKNGVQWFRKMQERGVIVKIITNSMASTDSLVAQFGYMRYRKDLLRVGVDLYELRATPEPRPGEDEYRGDLSRLRGSGSLAGSGGSSSHGALHAKLFVLDRQAVFIGSFNLDPRSARFDTQDGIVIHSPELAKQAAALFARDSSLTRSYRVSLTADDGLVWVTEENDKEVRYYREPLSGFRRRILGRFLFLITPESIL